MPGDPLTRTLLLVLAFALVTVPAALTSEAASSAHVLQPGDPLLTEAGELTCTLSFVFDEPETGAVYIATAAHCVDRVGQRAHTEGIGAFGTVAFLGDAGNLATDFALIQVDAEVAPSVEGSVRGHDGVPTGVASSEDTAPGDQVLMSGWGLATNPLDTTRENRTGALVDHTDRVVQLVGPVTNGDSGGPWVHESGLALGLVSQISVEAGIAGDPPLPHVFVGQQGPTLTGLVEDAGEAGFDLELRTAS